MQKRKSFLPTFLVFFILSILLFTLSRLGVLRGITGFLETATVPLQSSVFGIFHKGNQGETAKLKEENSELAKRLVDQTEMKRENQALRDQFQVVNPAPHSLIPAKIIGSDLDSLTLDRGKSEMVAMGDVVVFNNNLVGKIDRVSEHLATVEIITHADTSFTAKTLRTEAIGILKGRSGRMILENVVLSDHLEMGDLVVTKGNKDLGDRGYPPDLIIGKIISVNKKASNLFQSAEVKSLLDFGRLSMVFVKISN